MTEALTLHPCAKVNLFLHITGRRSDGYHTLQTVFQLIDLCDELTLRPSATLGFSPDSDQPGGEDDLCLRAARALQDHFGVSYGATLTLKKRIPEGGGLGGGSSDAAATLLGLNRLWGLGAPRALLAELGSRLGADVPVFVHGQTAWAEGVGERLTPLGTGERHLVVLHPGVSVPTKEIFSAPELTRDTPLSRIPAFFDGGGHNDCLPAVLARYPEVGRAQAWLSAFGPAQLTGTGACLFVPLPSRGAAEACAAAVPKPWRAWAVRALAESPERAEGKSTEA